jgi:trehalose 6-phosphate synthase
MQVVRDTDVAIWRDDFVACLRAVDRPANGDGSAARAA